MTLLEINALSILDVEPTLLERLAVKGNLTPTSLELEAEFDLYILDLTAILHIDEKLALMVDPIASYYAVGGTASNYDLYIMNEKISNPVALELLIDLMVIEDLKIVIANDKNNAIGVRKSKRDFGGEVLDYISYVNDQKVLTVADIQALSVVFSGIVLLLLQGSITTSRAAIAAADLTGTVFTEQERVDILAMIDAYLA